MTNLLRRILSVHVQPIYGLGGGSHTAVELPADVALKAAANADARQTLLHELATETTITAESGEKHLAPEPLPAPGKAGLVKSALLAPGGATLQDLGTLTGWQAHTVRAALSRLRKAGLRIERVPRGIGEARYIAVEGSEVSA